MTRVQLQPAYLLHRRPFRDSSQLLELFTLDHGRLPLIARGTSRRRRGGALGALLQPLRPLLVSFSGRGELATLAAVEPGGMLRTPQGERLFSALYLNELLSRLLHRHEAHPRLFADYAAALEALGGDDPVPPLLRHFELRLLEELGYAVDLRIDASSGAVLEPAAHYRVELQQGLVPVSADAAQRPESCFPGGDLLAIADGQVDGSYARSALRLTRELLAPYLGDAPLRSRELLRAYRC